MKITKIKLGKVQHYYLNHPYTDVEIKSHLDMIRESIENDVGKVLDGYSANVTGFFAVPRLLFPEIDGMGSFITGNSLSTTKNIITYFKTTLSKIDSRYFDYAAFITLVYRHGLLHQHSPKNFEYKRKDISWAFTMTSTNTPLDIQREFHLIFLGSTLQINLNVFCKDVLDSIGLLYEILIKSYRLQFSKSIKEQSHPLNLTSVIKKNKFIKPADFSFFKDLKLDKI